MLTIPSVVSPSCAQLQELYEMVDFADCVAERLS